MTKTFYDENKNEYNLDIPDGLTPEQELEFVNNKIAEARSQMNYVEPEYITLRRQAYPPLPEQLDMIYKDTINNTTKWTDLITEIKNKYPKG